jgi:hypothetical protein
MGEGMTLPLMECGHTAQGTRVEDGAPVCVICLGIVLGADVVNSSPPNLEGREAECAHCLRRQSSSTSLAFFQYDPDFSFDSFYDGCRGWD